MREIRTYGLNGRLLVRPSCTPTPGPTRQSARGREDLRAPVHGASTIVTCLDLFWNGTRRVNGGHTPIGPARRPADTLGRAEARGLRYLPSGSA